MAARYVDNNDGTFTLIGDNGAKASFMDPDGSYRNELDKMSTGTGEIAGASGDATASPTAPAPAGGFAPMGAPPPGLASNPALNPAAPPMVPGGAPPAPVAAPMSAAGPATLPPQVTTTISAPQTSMTQTTGTSNYSSGEQTTKKDPTGKIAAAQDRAIDAGHAANDALVEGKKNALVNSGHLIMNETLRAETEHATQTRIANQKEVAMADALADRKAKRAIPIDPGQAFADDAGGFALAATIGAAIANVGLAWMGQSAQPINVIDNLVNRSVAIQREQKQHGIDEASENVELTRAQSAEARANARVALQQQLDAQRRYTENDSQLQMLDSLYKDNEAKLARDEAEYAQAVSDNVAMTHQSGGTSGGTSTTTTSGGEQTVMKEGMPGKAMPAAQRTAMIKQLDGLSDALHGFDELDKSAGIVRDKDGKVVSSGDVVKGSYGFPEGIEDAAGAIPFGIGKELRKTIRGTEPEELKTVRRASEKITTGMAHAQSGAQTTDSELQRYQDRLPLTNAETFKASSAELYRELRQKYKTLSAEYGQSEVDSVLQKAGFDVGKLNGSSTATPPEKF